MHVSKELNDALERARALFREAQARYTDWGEPPFDPRRYAEMLQIPVSPFSRPSPWDALLLPVPEGFRILYNAAARSEGRQRFSIAHEIAHTLFPDSTTSVQRRAKRDAYETPEEVALERWCDRVAAELLMPEPVFRRLRESLGQDASAVPDLAETFQVSVSAAAVRFVETSVEPCAVVFFEWTHRPSVEKLPAELRSGVSEPRKYRVSSIYRNEAFPRFLAVGKSVSNRSVVYRCSLGTRLAEAEERFEAGRRAPYRVRVSAYPLHRQETVEGPPRVCAVLRSQSGG